MQIGLLSIFLAGCSQATQPETGTEQTSSDAKRVADEAQQAAEAVLGKQAVVLASGDLARNGLEQVLAVNPVARPDGGRQRSEAISITRAAILQKSNGKWTEVLLCDEHLKNPNGYLGGTSTAPASGWRLEFTQDAKQGLEMKFTPEGVTPDEEQAGTGEPASRAVAVRWNTKTKRYQSLDPSQERYLSEAPTLETPHSILR
jgi:hypothetical protein